MHIRKQLLPFCKNSYEVKGRTAEIKQKIMDYWRYANYADFREPENTLHFITTCPNLEEIILYKKFTSLKLLFTLNFIQHQESFSRFQQYGHRKWILMKPEKIV